MNEPRNESGRPFSESVHEAAEAIAAAGSAAVKLEEAAVDAIEQQLAQRPRWRTAVSVAAWTLVAAYFLFAALLLGMRYWLLPNIGRYTGLIEDKVSQVVGERVSIGRVTAGWDGLRPELDLQELRVFDGDGRQVLSLPAVEAVLSWRSLLLGSVHFHALALDRPDLAVRRDAEGRLYVAGMQIRSQPDQGPGLSDWVLRQSELSVRGAGIVWTDEQRGAPPLQLSGVNFVLRNSGATHRFAMQAAVPRELASMLDVRGELTGRDPRQPEQWRGRIYAELEYIDLEAWKRWLDYPIELRAGEGGLRLWLGFARKQLTELTADVALARVVTRTAADLPLLELDYLRGRLGGRRMAGGRVASGAMVTEVFGRDLALRSKGGVALPPAQFLLRLQQGRNTGGKEDGGEFDADALSLQPLAKLAEYLPLPAPLRKHLDAADPRGSVHQLKLSWKGPVEQLQAYTLRGSFEGLAMRAQGGIPGFAGLSGAVNANEKSGSVTLLTAGSAARAREAPEKPFLELPGVFAQGLRFDTLSGQTSWSFAPERQEFRFSDVSFANADAAGVLSGSFVTRPGSEGVVDLSASLSRADGRAVWRYFPDFLPATRDYLKSAILAGNSRDVQLKLKGDLAHFPFDDARQGRFLVTARIDEGELSYEPDWPRISGIAGDLAVEGRKLTVRAQRGTVLGARLSNVRAVIPDLMRDDPLLTVEGQADGPSSEFLRFVELSPVSGYIDGATQGMRAGGSGRLQLRLDLPIEHPEAVKVAGSVQFQNGQLTFSPDLPPLTQMNGRLEFSEAGMAMRGITAQFLGGPVTLNAQTVPSSRGREGGVAGGVSIAAQGTATMAAVRRLVSIPVLERVSGAASWRGTINARRGVLDVAIDSPLQGVAIDLPPPFGKTAAETLPLRVEASSAGDAETARRFRGLRAPPKGDVIAVSLGNAPGRSVNALVARRLEGRSLVPDRGVVALNEAAPLPPASGIALTGTLAYVDADRWQAALKAPAPATTGATTAAPASAANGVTAINLKIAALDVAGKRINDLTVRGQARGTQWNADVEARELKGEVRWRPEGRGVVQARLSHLITPADRPADPAGAGAAATADTATRELPALDIIADSFTLKDKQLGRLELVAVNEVRDWRIEKLVLSNPESTLTADGIWQSWAARPSISVNLKLEVSNLGRYLDRMGYPRIMANGTSRMEGKIGWAGSPQAPDFATLTGNLKLSAEKGQFLKADPGVAKLLGVLSLQSLVTLDLRDLFREGFAYDSISGTAAISKGVVTTDDFFMKGASAQVRMSGNIDLAQETQKLHLRVVPSLGDGASTITGVILANPIFGVGLTLLQRLLKDPLGQIFAVEYDVTGSWDDPKVTRTKVETPAETAQVKE